MQDILLVFLVLAFFYAVFKFFAYPAFLSPLSQIPSAHFSSPFSPLWILLRRHEEKEIQTIDEAHRKHGLIVRLGPNEVSVNCVDDGIKTVYSGGFEKWWHYQNLFFNFGCALFPVSSILKSF